MKGERGQTIILVLALLAIGALTITPVLLYTAGGLLRLRVSESEISSQIGADSALEDALLRALTVGLKPGDTAIGYNFTYGTSRYPISITVPSVPASQDLSTGSMKYLMVNATPNFLTGKIPGDTSDYYTDYSIRVRTQPWSSARSTLEITLPLGMDYVANSTWSNGPVPQNSYPIDTAVINYTAHTVAGRAMVNNIGLNTQPLRTTEPSPYNLTYSYIIKTTMPDGRKHIKYSFIPSGTGGNMNYVLIFKAMGKPKGGIHYSLFSANIEGGIQTEVPTAAIGVALYTVRITIDGVQYDVKISFDSDTGKMNIISYTPV
jgi:hypothetical protein